ncbi:CoA transferase [Arthrobacter sp. I2-34]|uniref:CoA transferase n=1 Tax=Arthrobacter hankyongi TaxID=2904801 RepID=A0ABS9L9T5_9MICC|nr:CoA transferase [Arthrobacter hankyongi]MCG2623425.1 CoA transferase [Arthrobacter hankyongi]
MNADQLLLEGVRVLEMGQYISAPSAARALADLGATIIKVENPLTGGDPTRWMRGGETDWSPQYASWNRGKKSVALDVKSEEGRRALHTLVGTCDVLLDNVRPGVLDRLGLGPEELKAINPGLIHCTITGFGPTGPMADQPGYDSVISARSGLYSEMTLKGSTPAGPLFSDLLTGMRAVQLISAALVHRERTGKGCRLDVPMLGTVTDFMGEAVAQVTAGTHTGESHARQARVGMLACTAADGKSFILNIGERPETFELLKEIFEANGALDDSRFATFNDRVNNHIEFNAAVNRLTVLRDRDEWMKRCAEGKLPASPMQTLAEAIEDEQAKHLGLVEETRVDTDRTIRLASPGFLVNGKPATGQGVPPNLGADTRAELEAVGVPAGDVAAIEATIAAAGIDKRVEARRALAAPTR